MSQPTITVQVIKWPAHNTRRFDYWVVEYRKDVGYSPVFGPLADFDYAVKKARHFAAERCYDFVPSADISTHDA
jgi:hypothetical protein